MSQDSPDYLKKQRFYKQLLTIYGRKPVLEALQQDDLPCHRLHLAKTNKSTGIISDILQLAESRQIEIVYHSREALSRISKNHKQDQGIAADIICPTHTYLDSYLDSYLDDYLGNKSEQAFSFIALDGITNPQNLGMIIRSVTASPCDGIIIPEKGNASLSPLVVKASAGSIFKSTLLYCESLVDAIAQLKNAGAKVCVLAGDSQNQLCDLSPTDSVVYILGNETNGVSEQVRAAADIDVKIPMANGVESLNVAVTAALISFRTIL